MSFKSRRILKQIGMRTKLLLILMFCTLGVYSQVTFADINARGTDGVTFAKFNLNYDYGNRGNNNVTISTLSYPISIYFYIYTGGSLIYSGWAELPAWTTRTIYNAWYDYYAYGKYYEVRAYPR